MAFNISENGANLIKSFESCRLTAYKLSGEAYWTIGWGHYGADVYEGMTITQAEADRLFLEDVQYFVNGVNSIAVSKFPSMNQNQFDALCSYAYNRGLGNSAGTNGLRQLIYNSNSLAEVSANFPVYWGTATQYKDALIARRNKERALFDTPVDGDENENVNPEHVANARIIESAIDWAVKVALNDIHGYDQTNRWGNDYDCSSLLIQAYENAGCPVKSNGATYTGNMETVFKATGFNILTYSKGMDLQKGDVLWRSGHVAMYIGSGNIVSAHINEKGTTTGGKTGDQTGHEIDISSFATSGTWKKVFRLPADFSGSEPEPPTPEPINKGLSKLLLYVIATDMF